MTRLSSLRLREHGPACPPPAEGSRPTRGAMRQRPRFRDESLALGAVGRWRAANKSGVHLRPSPQQIRPLPTQRAARAATSSQRGRVRSRDGRRTADGPHPRWPRGLRACCRGRFPARWQSWQPYLEHNCACVKFVARRRSARGQLRQVRTSAFRRRRAHPADLEPDCASRARGLSTGVRSPAAGRLGHEPACWRSWHWRAGRPGAGDGCSGASQEGPGQKQAQLRRPR